MKISALLLAALALAGFPSRPAGPAPAFSYTSDRHILNAASVTLGHGSVSRVLTWLRRQPSVQFAAEGRDGRTVEVRFRDGLHAAILPGGMRTARLATLQPQVQLASPNGSGARAAVLMPFAAELGLGSNAGDVEVNDLQTAGFSVDQAYDTQVTLGVMASLSQYNAVYMLTHTGLGANGAGLVATGELYGTDPSAGSYIQDGSVMAAQVAGSTNLYYAITPLFVSRHMGQFPTSSLLFVNGCALLPATPFWQALSAKGLTTLVSWDNDVQTKDDFLSAAAFFNVMGQGKSVATSISTLQANGYGTSSSGGQTATMGYQGDGSLTLQRAEQAGGTGGPAPSPTTTPPRPTPVRPTSTPRPAPTSAPPPQQTSPPPPRPTATRTSASTHPPVVLPLTALRAKVKPGSSQTILVQRLTPGTAVHFTVRFPNGDGLQADRTADSRGAATYSYVQPGSTITRHNSMATVSLRISTPSSGTSVSLRYRIDFGVIDVAVQPRVVPAGGAVSLDVHSRVHKRVIAVVIPPAGKRTRFDVRTAKSGWAHLTYHVPHGLKRGSTVLVRARTYVGSKAVKTKTTFKIG